MPRQQLPDSEFLQLARERYKLANESDTYQAERERDDIAFEDGDQWPVDVKLARQGQQPTSGMPAVPARPTLVINKIKEPIRQILNQERQADLGVEIIPADDFGDLGIIPDKTEIELREGLIRRIQRASHASDARRWAFKRAVIAGRGYYLVMTRYLPGKTREQEIYVDRIYNQEAVKGDPSRQKPDGSDADFWFVGTWMLFDKFTAKYPKDADGKDNPLRDYNDTDFMGLTEQYPDWYQSYTTTKDSSGKETRIKQQSIRIVDHWYVKYESRELSMLSSGDDVWSDELGELPESVTVSEKRQVTERKIKWCKIAGGCMILEQTDWVGPDMPIIQVIGDEVLPYDNQKRYEGMVRPSRDGQMGENYMISKFVETVGLSPIPPIHVDPEAISGYESWYGVLNTRALPYAPSRTYDDQGRQLAPPTRLNVDPNIQPMAVGIKMFEDSIRSTTAVPDPTLGNVDPTLKSARAIKEVVGNAQLSTLNFMDNFVRSLEYEAQVENNLLYPIYGQRPGRLVRIMTGEGESQTIQIGMPQNGVQHQLASKVAKLTQDANFNTAVKVGKSWDTRREQLLSTLSSLVAAEPMQMAVVGDMFYRNMDVPGHEEMADRQRVMLAPQVQAYLQAKENGQQFDPVAAAQIQQLKQQVQHAEAAMAELKQMADGKVLDYQKAIESEKIKQDAETQREAMRFEHELRLQAVKNAAPITVASINAETKGVIRSQEAEEERLALQSEMAHDTATLMLTQQHEQQQANDQQSHEAAMGAMRAAQPQSDEEAQV